MSTTPSSAGQIRFYGPPESVKVEAKSTDDYTWLTLSHEAFEEDEDEGQRRPGWVEVEVAMWGAPEALHAFALRLVAAIEAEWPETVPAESKGES